LYINRYLFLSHL